MATSAPISPRLQLAKAVRERFFADMGKAMVEIGELVLERLTTLMDEPGSAREGQLRRDVWTAYKRCRPLWLEATNKVWHECLEPSATPKKKLQSAAPDALQLVGADVVENKILASRLVLSVMEKVGTKFEDLRIRIRYLEGVEELGSRDLFRPEVLILHMVEEWSQVGMPADAWVVVNESVQALLGMRMAEAYDSANAVLVKKGVMPTIALADRVKAVVRRPAATRPVGANARPENMPQPADARQGAATEPGEANLPGRPNSGFFGGRLGWGAKSAEKSEASAERGRAQDSIPSAPPVSRSGSVSSPFWRQSTGGSGSAAIGNAASEETRMMTAVTPLARARSRAQGVIGQIRRMFVSHAGGDFLGAAHQQPSPALAAAIAPPRAGQTPVYATGGTLYEDYSPAGIARIVGDLREKTADLKKKAETKGEKGTIEIVALMFQAILSEERIPPGIRVWFARLQMPVLRVALEDPDFFGTTTHPARVLIDRMGSCVMG
ncbi:MAG: DUF1631 family protein, partial [Rhodoferax sp.]